MKQGILATWWSQINRLWQSGDAPDDDIRVPTPEQQMRARLAFERLRNEALAMKAPFTTDEILDMVRSGRR
jgi:hypothetical protein